MSKLSIYLLTNYPILNPKTWAIKYAPYVVLLKYKSSNFTQSTPVFGEVILIMYGAYSREAETIYPYTTSPL